VTPEWFLMFRLAVADLFHETALSLCLLLALAAVMCPILLAFGLKYGTIETLRGRLNGDPTKREIVVRSSFNRPSGWIDALAERPDVGFVIAKTRPLSNEVLVRGKGTVRVAIEPTGPGDPVLSFERIAAPAEGEVVLSSLAADELGVNEGDEVSLVAEAYREGNRVEAEVRLRVCGVLQSRGRRVMYARLPLLEAIEAFKDGRGVPHLGWPGGDDRPQPLYQGVIVLSRQALPDELQARLLVNTGLTRIRELSREELKEKAGWRSADAGHVYFLNSEKARLGEEVLEVLNEKLRGMNCGIIPWAPPIQVRMSGDMPGGEFLMAGLSVSRDLAKSWGITPVLPWELNPANIYQIAFSAPDAATGGQVTISPIDDKSFPPFHAASVAGPGQISNILFVPNELAGIVNRAARDSLAFDQERGEFFLLRKGYSWMRIYARSIDDVASLSRYLEKEENLSISTQVERIEEVNELNRHLSRILYFLAGVGVLGGIGTLASSLYAAIERKRRELGVLRLVGLTGREVLRFPVYQGLLLAAGGYGLAVGVAVAASSVINGIFRQQLRTDERFCELPPSALLAGFGLVVFLAVSASGAAALKLNRLQPSAAIRAE
jgi:putative ABC transport system permease protein